MRIKPLISIILIVTSVGLLAVALIYIPKAQNPILTFSNPIPSKWVDYYLDAQKVNITVNKQNKGIEFISQNGKFTLPGESNYDVMVALVGSWSKTFENDQMYSLVPPATCTSLLLRFKYLDYTKLEVVGCTSTPIQYSELI